jgi:hypothetical protein
VKVTDLLDVDAWFFIVGSNGVYTTTPLQITNLVNQANPHISQFGIRLRIAGITHTNNPAWYDIANSRITAVEMGKVINPANGLKVFFVNTINGGSTLGFNDPYCMATAMSGIDYATLPITFAHEIGHSCNLRDIYARQGGLDIYTAGVVQAGYMDAKDWGAGYYANDLLHTNLITRLLMYGYDSPNAGHVPHGRVYGVHRPTRGAPLTIGMAPIGLDSPNFIRQPKHNDLP